MLGRSRQCSRLLVVTVQLGCEKKERERKKEKKRKPNMQRGASEAPLDGKGYFRLPRYLHCCESRVGAEE